MTSRRRLAFLLALAAALPALAGAQEAYPTKPIRLVLPYATGGSADALARAVAEQMRVSLGQQVLVDSRPGANSMLGAELVAQAPKDGYTLLYVGWPTISTNTVTYRDIRYKVEDFQPITTLFRSPVSLTVRKDLPVSNLKELIEYARRQGGITFGTAGAGSSPHLLMSKLSQATGVPFQHVPYKGEGPAVQDVLGGHLPLFAGSLATPAAHVKAGALKVIATSAPERLPAFPEVGTFREAGFPEHVFTFWHGIAAPAGVPKPIIDKLHAAIAAAMNSPTVRNLLSPDQLPTIMTPEAFTALIRKDIETWGPVIRANNLVE